jgi:hypothetical protein
MDQSKLSGSKPGHLARSLVVSKNRRIAAGWLRVLEICSLTIEFEGRETQAAESWRVHGRKTGDLD